MSDLTIKRGDYGFNLTGTVSNDDGTDFDLTDYTVSLQVWEEGRWRRPFVQGTCVVTSSTEGQWSYTVASGDFLVAGTYNGAIRATKTNAQETTVTYTIEVKETP